MDEGALATLEVCRAEVREVEEDWISRWELARRKKTSRETHNREERGQSKEASGVGITKQIWLSGSERHRGGEACRVEQ